jgi:hypothetical protein
MPHESSQVGNHYDEAELRPPLWIFTLKLGGEGDFCTHFQKSHRPVWASVLITIWSTERYGFKSDASGSNYLQGK